MPFVKVNLSAVVLFGTLGYFIAGPVCAAVMGAAILGILLIWQLVSTQLVFNALKAKLMTDASVRSSVIHRLFLGDANALRDSAGLKATRFYMIDTHVPLAFSMGVSTGSSYIVVTSGLFKTLTRLEVSAVIGHELGHIKAGDSALNAMRLSLSLFISALRIRPIVSVFSNMFPRTTLITNLLLKPECRADAFSATLCKDAKILASALKKLERGVRAVQWSALDTVPFLANVAVVDPFAAQESYDRPEQSKTAYRVAELYRLEPESKAA